MAGVAVRSTCARRLGGTSSPSVTTLAFWNQPTILAGRADRPLQKGSTMRRLRFLAAISAIAGLAIMGATGASADPAHQAAHTRTMVAPSTADPWEFNNPNGLYIAGAVHNSALFGDTAGATAYVEYDSSSPPGWWVYSAQGLCWNSAGASGDHITMESCPSDDIDEWFHLTSPVNGPYGLLETWSGLCVWGAGNGNSLYLHACEPGNHRDDWYKASVS